MNVKVLPPLETVGKLLASAGSILVPAVPCTPRLKVKSGVLTTEYSSVPWVVKSSPWSADSGGVPDAIVIVPPFLPWVLELLVDVDELPHAASTTARTAAVDAATIGLMCLCTCPPPVWMVAPRKCIGEFDANPAIPSGANEPPTRSQRAA